MVRGKACAVSQDCKEFCRVWERFSCAASVSVVRVVQRDSALCFIVGNFALEVPGIW